MTLEAKLLDHLKAFDTPTVCNALEIVAPERRATGFTTRPFVCAFPALAPIVGVARTARIRATEPPPRSREELRTLRLGYYGHVAATGLPTVAVIEDLDP